MSKEACTHIWKMIDVKEGLIVMKKCFHCSKVSTCFVDYQIPPVGASHEGEHYWDFMESIPSFHFDLKCSKCDEIVVFDELVGIMACTGCDESCQVDVLRNTLVGEGSNVHIALGQRPRDERTQLSEEKLAILSDFYHQQGKHLPNEVEIVSHEMIKDMSKCYAEVIGNPYKVYKIPEKSRKKTEAV